MKALTKQQERLVTTAKTVQPILARPGLRFSLAGQGALRVAAALVALVLVWWALTDATGLVSTMRFPGPTETLAAWKQILFDGYSNARWHEHVLRSVRLVVMGFVVASTLGVAIGL